MNRRLAKAIIAAFKDNEAATLRSNFAPFEERDWLRGREWLHTSGLALYFLDRVKALGAQSVIPAAVLYELEENLAENRVRGEDLFREFATINMEFQRAKLSYANLKGFSLAPRACPNPAYRYQHDLDFLVSRHDAERCRQAVERQGYRLTATFGNTWEFRAGPPEIPTMRDLYRVRGQRSLEVHLVPEQEQGGVNPLRDRLSHLQLQMWNGFEFPALSECDKLVDQALHLFKHFQTEWTRAAWMLEYATAIRWHGDDEGFWRQAAATSAASQDMKIGVGIATLVTSRAFSVAPPAHFLACTVDEVPEHVRLWVDRYGDELLFLEHPGSKLYLLLKDVLLQGHTDWQNQRRRKLFPARLPARHIVTSRSDGRRLRAKVAGVRVAFIWKRFCFHLAEGLRYKVEAARWKRFVADSRA